MVKLVCFACGQANRVPDERLRAGPKCGTCGAALADGKAHEIDAATLAKAIRTDGLPLVVDLWAPWCGPCRRMAPQFSQAAQGVVGRARLVKLNTEAEPAAARRFGIRGIPTMIAFARGRETGRRSGALPAAEIAAFAVAGR